MKPVITWFASVRAVTSARAAEATRGEIPGMPAMGGLTIEPDTSSASMVRLPVGSTLSNDR